MATTRRSQIFAAVGAVAVHGAVAAFLIAPLSSGRQSSPGPDGPVVYVDLTPTAVVYTKQSAAQAEQRPPVAVSEAAERDGTLAPTVGANGTGAPSAETPAPDASGRAVAQDGGATAAPGALASGDTLQFQRALLAHIEHFRSYPQRARQAGVEGVVLLRFSMDRRGVVTDAWIEHSSGSTSLDAEALAAIQRAQPLPQIPSGLPDQLSFAMPISFTLRSAG